MPIYLIVMQTFLEICTARILVFVMVPHQREPACHGYERGGRQLREL
jgi:hypothetical protein